MIFLNRPAAYPVPVALVILDFTVGLVAATVLFNWATERSASMWPAVVMHSAHNCGGGVLERMIAKCDAAEWLVGETGLVLSLVILAFAAFFWSRRLRAARSQEHEQRS